MFGCTVLLLRTKPGRFVVLTRDSALRYLSTVTVAPVTLTIRGVPPEVRLDEEGGLCPSAQRASLRTE
jgi:mRNA interferase MazF